MDGFFLATALSSTLLAQVDSQIHEKCIKASDYKGCVEILSGALKERINPGTQNIKLNIDTQVSADGNQCPSEFAYAGAGYCRRVVCVYAGLFGRGHHPDLAGKGMRCHKGVGQMQWGEWDKEKVRASVNDLCPTTALEVGWNNTCAMLTLRAANLSKEGRYSEAIAIAKPIADKDKNNWLAASSLGNAYFLDGNYSEALVYYRLADSAAKDKDAKFLTELNLALALEKTDPGNQESLRLLKNVVRLKPDIINRDYQKQVMSPQEISLLGKLLKELKSLKD